MISKSPLTLHDAVRFLHDRHPGVIDSPEDGLNLEMVNHDIFWLQLDACELIDARSERSLRRCFASIHHVLVKGDREARIAVLDHFLQPHLVFHPDLAWAKTVMPPLLAEACEKLQEAIDAE